MTGNEVLALLAYMSAAWPSVEVTEDTARVWTEHLAKIDGNDALAAANVLINESKWFPSIAEFRDAARAQARFRGGEERAIEHRKQLANPERGQEQPSVHRSRAEQIEHNRQWIAEFKDRTSLSRRLAPGLQETKARGETKEGS